MFRNVKPASIATLIKSPGWSISLLLLVETQDSHNVRKSELDVLSEHGSQGTEQEVSNASFHIQSVADFGVAFEMLSAYMSSSNVKIDVISVLTTCAGAKERIVLSLQLYSDPFGLIKRATASRLNATQSGR
jgi:hypothetical protein